MSALAGCSRAAVGFAAVSQCCFLVPISVVPQPGLLVDTYWPILTPRSPSPTEGLCTRCSFHQQANCSLWRTSFFPAAPIHTECSVFSETFESYNYHQNPQSIVPDYVFSVSSGPIHPPYSPATPNN